MEGDWGNKKFVLEQVKLDGLALEKASDELKGDKEVVTEAIKNGGGDVLRYASEKLRGDKQLVLMACKRAETGPALRYASKELQADREVVLESVKIYGYALEYASEELKADREIVLEAVKSDAIALAYANEKFYSDKEIVMKALTEIDDLDFFEEILSNGRISDELMEDKEVQSQLIKIFVWFGPEGLDKIDEGEPYCTYKNDFRSNEKFMSELRQAIEENERLELERLPTEVLVDLETQNEEKIRNNELKIDRAGLIKKIIEQQKILREQDEKIRLLEEKQEEQSH